MAAEEYSDLKKLILSKDQTATGKISYEDFSAWVGNSIHMSEGFYFRHDSVKNPQYENQQSKKKEHIKFQE